MKSKDYEYNPNCDFPLLRYDHPRSKKVTKLSVP